MQWEEIVPLPEECRECNEKACYNCDYAGKRWKLPREYELHLKRKGILKTMERLEKQLKDIDDELRKLRVE